MNAKLACFTSGLALAAVATWTCVDAAPTSSAQAGERIAHAGADGAPPCISCHGAHGEGNAAGGFPRLAGLGAAYLQRQLSAFSSGERKNAVMEPIAKALKADGAQAVSAYFASLPAPASRHALALDGSAAAALVHEGRWSEARLPACVQCHGPDVAGVGSDFPPLEGQPAAYIAAQLRAWREGTRPPGPQGLMQAVAMKLEAPDIDAVSQYLGGAD
ncbi:MAG TPA: c-type cytochrome, partial [Usitatibacter sp.]|nr:c-type cytochrome [Usitatibacter sp.]